MNIYQIVVFFTIIQVWACLVGVGVVAGVGVWSLLRTRATVAGHKEKLGVMFYSGAMLKLFVFQGLFPAGKVHTNVAFVWWCYRIALQYPIFVSICISLSRQQGVAHMDWRAISKRDRHAPSCDNWLCLQRLHHRLPRHSLQARRHKFAYFICRWMRLRARTNDSNFRETLLFNVP